MNLPNLDLNLLKVFVAIYRERNLTRAANAMSVTPPALSIKLRKLNEEFGGDLFIKVPTGLEPTALGENLYNTVEPLLVTIHSKLSDLTGFEPSKIEDSLTLDVSQHFMAWLGPRLYFNLNSHAPKASLTTNSFSSNTINRLKNGDVDVGIQYARVPVAKEVMEIPLGRSPMVILVGINHPYKKKTATLKDLQPYELAMIELNLSELGQKGHFMHESRKFGANFSLKFTSPSVTAVANVLSQSTMFCPASKHLIELYPNQLRCIELKEDMQHLTMYPISAYIHRRNRHSPKHQWMIELIREEFAERCNDGLCV